jgi:hypothetical protein
MPRSVALLALGLVAVGIIYPITTGAPSWTAYIPAILGGVLLLLGLWRSPAARIVALLVALVGVVMPLKRLFGSTPDLGNPAHQALTLTALLCALVLVVLVRRARSAS